MINGKHTLSGLCAIVPGLLLLLCGFITLGSCASSGALTRAEDKRIELFSGATEQLYPLEPYFALASIYRGLFEPLSLDLILSLEEKFAVTRMLFFQSPLLQGLGGTPGGGAGESTGEAGPGKVIIDRFFESGEPLEILFSRFHDPYRLEWMSNCIHSPLLQAPLLGRGQFIGNQGQVYNYGDAILLHRGRPLRMGEMKGAEEFLRSLRGEKTVEKRVEPSLPERLNTALVLLEGGYLEEWRVVKLFFDSLEWSIPAALVQAEWNLALGNYPEVVRFLESISGQLPEAGSGSDMDMDTDVVDSQRRILANFRDRYLLQIRLEQLLGTDR